MTSAPASKLMPLHEAIRRFVSDGCSIVTGTYMEQKIPFAAGHEIIRQRKRDLTLVGPISDILFDQLIGAGCVRCVKAAWVGNVMMGSAYNFRRAFEEGIPHPLEVVDYSNFTLALALHAAALGVPYLPTQSTLGSNLLSENSGLVSIASPAGGETLVAVQAIHPDVAIVHACKADENGNGLAWGNLGVTVDAVMAAQSVIVIAEEIVDPAVLRANPNQVVIPGYRVTAVCHVPWGCHPSPAQGYYERDHEWFAEYHSASRDRERFEAWLQQWVYKIADQSAYVSQIGEKSLMRLKCRKSPAINHPVGA